MTAGARSMSNAEIGPAEYKGALLAIRVAVRGTCACASCKKAIEEIISNLERGAGERPGKKRPVP